jgi:hypothetical protein
MLPAGQHGLRNWGRRVATRFGIAAVGFLFIVSSASRAEEAPSGGWAIDYAGSMIDFNIAPVVPNVVAEWLGGK